MLFKRRFLSFAAAFTALGGAHAATGTLDVGSQVETDLPMPSSWGTEYRASLSDLNGVLSFQFSPLFITALNTAKVTLGEVAPAHVDATTVQSPVTLVTRLSSASMAAPVTSLTFDFGGNQAVIEQAAFVGGMALSTIKNGATNGSGFLQISNLRLDLVRGAVLADISGGNGVGSLRGFQLWNYTAVTDPTGYAAPDFGGVSDPFLMREVRGSNGFTGLFAPQQSLDMIAQALNLNAIGRHALAGVNDPLRGEGAGFGSLALNFSVRMNGPVSVSLAVPEPSSCAMLAVGGLCAAWFARRRQAVQPSA